jgi:hypothetical protein
VFPLVCFAHPHPLALARCCLRSCWYFYYYYPYSSALRTHIHCPSRVVAFAHIVIVCFLLITRIRPLCSYVIIFIIIITRIRPLCAPTSMSPARCCLCSYCYYHYLLLFAFYYPYSSALRTDVHVPRALLPLLILLLLLFFFLFFLLPVIVRFAHPHPLSLARCCLRSLTLPHNLCVCVCVCVCIHIYTHTHICVYTCMPDIYVHDTIHVCDTIYVCMTHTYI